MQHVDRDAKGVEIKTDVDVITDADCITMDDGDLRSGVKKMIDDRIGNVDLSGYAKTTDIVDFKRCIVLTQSEYGALSSTEKNRADTLYFIKA